MLNPSPETIFRIHLILGYVAWALAFFAYFLPRFRTMSRFEVQRFIATLHGFRFFGLVFILPGFVGPHLPQPFGVVAAWGDFATGVLAVLALMTQRIRPLFWLFVVAYTFTGMADLLADYYDATIEKLPAVAGEMGAAYIIPVIYVPLLMITHLAALYWLVRRDPRIADAARIGKIA